MTVDPKTMVEVAVFTCVPPQPMIVIELGVRHLDNPAEVFTVLAWSATLN